MLIGVLTKYGLFQLRMALLPIKRLYSLVLREMKALKALEVTTRLEVVVEMTRLMVALVMILYLVVMVIMN